MISHRPRWFGVEFTIALLLTGPGAWGQKPLLTRTLDSATIVRLHFVNDGVAEGPLLAPFGPTMPTLRYCPALSRSCNAVAVPTATLSRLEIQTGTRATRGFLLGTLLAGVVITPLVYIGGSFSQGETRGSLLAKGIGLSVIIGGGLGLLIGHSDRTWSSPP